MFPYWEESEVGSSISHEDAYLGLNSTEFNSKREQLVPVWSHDEGWGMVRGMIQMTAN